MRLIVALLIVIGDQLTKFWVHSHLEPGQSVPILPPWLYLTYVQNPGAAFGLMAERTPFLILTTAAAAAVVVWKRKEISAQGKVFRWGVALTLAGAAGNFIDRIRIGRVLDFIDMRIWWIFNVADMAIVTGVTLLIWSMLFASRDEKR
ncbi:MAG TPA: signal peptidase II [Firmicutes bacterium]|nr:signal peptidase II [Bacillota bacterium]